MKFRFSKTICFIAALSMLFCACGGNDENAQVPVQPVSVAASVSGSGQNRYSGKAVSPQTQKVGKDESRTVGELKVAEGDEVKAGDVLFTYDVDEMELNIEQAELSLEQLRNSISVAENQIETLKKERENARKSVKLEYTLQIQALEVEIKETEYNISLKEVEIERLKNSLDDREVVSGIDGIVQAINDGGYDNYGNPLPYISIMQVGNYRVEGKIAETNIGSVYAGMPVTVRSRLDPEVTWTGTIDEIDTENTAQSDRGMYYYESAGENATKYPFYVSLDSSEGLMLGQHVYIEVGEASGRTAGIWIDPYFLRLEGDQYYAWVADDDDELEKRAVTVDETDEMTGELHIAEGLSVQDYIAADSEELAEGLAVMRYSEGDFALPDPDVADPGEEGVFYEEGMEFEDGDAGELVIIEE